METRGLIFIPDISGFTKFVNQSEIEHSRLIIQELLETLINANESGLEISEIEGDAILFYRFGEPLDLQKLYTQVEKMFCAFHRHLAAYEHRRLCQCKACISAIDLSLKVVTHYGEFTSYNVKNFHKLIGKDIIVAHQLLKNDIEEHEYWLVTKNLSKNHPPQDFADWMKWDESVKQTESGAIPFHYTQLSELKKEIPSEPLPQLDLSEKVKMVSVSREYDATTKELFFTAGHFEFRHRWQEGVKQVVEVTHTLPVIGSRYRHILDNGQAVLYTSSFSYDPDSKIVFSETDEKTKTSTHFVLEKINENKSRLTLELYLPKNFIAQTFFKIAMKRKMETIFQRSLVKLDQLLKEIPVPEF
ncbi:MAG TPA: DUF2652 domain-containing protein [Chitinophagaceae bacterium]|nr:DUF2652 domain-containing protein [Chitinophagaceae bacterium]